MAEKSEKKKRGFASMSAERRREVAAKGGRTAHKNGKAFRFTKKAARKAGSKGGKATSKIPGHLEAAGRKGGKERARRAAAKKKES